MSRPHPAPVRLRLVEPSGEDEASAQPASSPEPRWTSGECAAPAELGATPMPPRAGALPQRRAEAERASELPDARLVALGAAGDREALEALYRRHAPFAIHLATRIEGSARDVEDIVHDAFIKAFQRLPELHDRAAFKAWLGAIVVHAVRSRLRRGRLMTMLGLGKNADPVDLDALTSRDASPATRAQVAQIYALLRTLPADERIAWTLRSVEGHELEAVARMTGCSLATVKRRISRVQRFLEEHFIDPERPAGGEESAEIGNGGRAESAPPRVEGEPEGEGTKFLARPGSRSHTSRTAPKAAGRPERR